MSKQPYLLLIGLSFALTSLAQLPQTAEIKKLKIKKITRQEQANSSAAGSTVWFYNANGDDTAYYDYGSRAYYQTFEYDAKQRVKSIDRYSNEGKHTEKTIFDYKIDGSFASKNTDTQYRMIYTSEFDKNGNLLKKTIPDGSVHLYEYNSKGLLVKVYSVPKRGSLEFTHIYTYNAIGKPIKIVKTGDYPSTSTYEYDTKGLLKKEIVMDEDDNKIVHLYSFGY